ncbi:MAG: hypothetical protein IH897_03680 [Planctomycetes bacterium]|nr:hypothetical protein [Planctomycetota bacterium]
MLGTFRTLLFILGLGVSVLSARATEPFLVRDINPGAGAQSFVDGLASVNGTLFFSAFDGGASGRELWRSDVTAAGAVMVKDIHPQFSATIMPRELTGAAERLLLQSD